MPPTLSVSVIHEDKGGDLAINYSRSFCRAELQSPVHAMWFHVFLY